MPNRNKTRKLFICYSLREVILLILLLQITKLKIDSNPFAKGFRDSSRLTEFERYLFFFYYTT